MRNRFVHLGFNPLGAIAGQPSAAAPPNYHVALEYYLSHVCGDWYRYGSQNYVLWTAQELSDLATQIALLPGYSNFYVLLTEMSGPAPAQSNGWMPQRFWDWLNQTR